ncbi:hypothetical protein ABZ214_18830 [Streptomyces iakyrus]
MTIPFLPLDSGPESLTERVAMVYDDAFTISAAVQLADREPERPTR